MTERVVVEGRALETGQPEREDVHLERVERAAGGNRPAKDAAGHGVHRVARFEDGCEVAEPEAVTRRCRSGTAPGEQRTKRRARKRTACEVDSGAVVVRAARSPDGLLQGRT